MSKGKKESKKRKSQMFKLASVWKRDGENKTFYSGNVNIPIDVIIKSGSSIMIFKNESDSENAPDYDIMVGDVYNPDAKASEDEE